MKAIFTKRVIAPILAFVLCICAAGAALAVEGRAVATRTIAVDTDEIITEGYRGVGTNHWSSPYGFGMNDAYQLVNEKRNNMQQPKYIRMLFMPQWIVDTTLPAEQQEYEWNNGIYHFDNIDVQNFSERLRCIKRVALRCF